MVPLTPVDAARLRTAFLRHHEENTRLAYRADLESFARWAQSRGRRPDNVHEALADLLNQPADKAIEMAEDYKESMAGVKENSFRRRISTLRNFCAYVKDRGEIGWRLAVNSRVARTAKQAESATPRDMSGPPEEQILELRRMLKADDTPLAIRNLALLDLHYYRSLRLAEVVRLDVRHFTPEKGMVSIRGKGRGTFEELVLNQATAESIKAWLRVRPGAPSGPLFVRLDRGATAKRAGHRLTENAIERVFEKQGSRVGCDIRPHGLRHSAITVSIVQAAKDRRPLTSVQRFARHKSFNTTAGYVNVVAADVKEVMDAMRT